MLHVTLTPHRTALRAHVPMQKLFVLLTLLPDAARHQRPQVHLAIVVDTSGSMREQAPTAEVERTRMPGRSTRGPRKLDLAMQAALSALDSPQLRGDDWVAIIHFDDEARVLAEGRVGEAMTLLRDGVARLQQYKGQTRMSEGLRCAVEAFKAQEPSARKVLLLTDGRTTHEAECRRAADALLELQAPVVAFGIGDQYNEDLLADICSRTRGKPQNLRDMTKLAAIFEAELGLTARQVISAVEVQLKLVQGVHLSSVTRVYPSLAEIRGDNEVLQLGAIAAGDYSIFLLELDVAERRPIRTRLAQVQLEYHVTGAQERVSTGPYDLITDVTLDEERAAIVDANVLAYVQQRNIEQLIRTATGVAQRDPAAAMRTLNQAGSLSERFGNTGLTIALREAEAELATSGQLTALMTKTIKLGARTQTVRMEAGAGTLADLPDAETIRKITGA